MPTPTSIRLTDEQAVALDHLAAELAARRPDLAAAARGGTLTPGRVLVLALDRGIAELRADLDGRPPVPPDDLPSLLRRAADALAAVSNPGVAGRDRG